MAKGKRTSNNSLKKLNKQLDQLLKEKQELDNTAVIKKADIIKKKNEEEAIKKKKIEAKKKKSVSNNKKKNVVNKDTVVLASTRKIKKDSDVVVVPTRKKSNKSKINIPTSKKDIKKFSSTNISKKKKNRKKLKEVTMVDTPKVVKQETKKEVSESTLKLRKLESEIKDLYNDDSYDKTIETKEYKIDDNKEKSQTVINNGNKKLEKKDDRLREKKIYFSDIVIYGLFIIFIIMFVLFIAFIIYVCTY